MWNSWCFRTEIREDESEKVNEQLIDSFFIDFDRILCVAIERFDLLDEIDRETIFVENIWLRDVAKNIDEACEADESIIVDFFAILYADSSAKTRRSELLTDFRAWFWRRCSWSLLLKLKICLQRLQIVRTQTICEFDVIFVSFDVILNVAIERFEHFDETNCKDILVSVARFLDVAEKIDDFCEEDEHAIADFFSDLHTDLSVVVDSNIEFWDFATFFWAFCSINSACFWAFCLISLWVRRSRNSFNRCLIFRISTFWISWRINSIFFWVEIMIETFAVEVIADFSVISHVELIVRVERNESLTDFFACCSRLCLRSTFLELNVWLQCRHVVDFFVDFDLISNVESERFERFSRVIVLNAIADSNIDFWDFEESFCETNNVFSISHTKSTALIERWKFLTSFRISWLRICSYNSLLKLKFCLQNLQIIRTHVVSWFDALFIDCDAILTVAIERFELVDEMTVSKKFADSNICSDDFANETNKKASESESIDFFIVSHISLIERILRCEFFEKNSKTTSNDEVTVDFFIVSHVKLIVASERFKHSDRMIDSKNIAVSNICFCDVVKVCEACRVNESTIVDFFIASHIELIATISRDESMTNFLACWLRTWSRNCSLMLKLSSHRMQIIFEILTNFANEALTKSTCKISIHSLIDVDFMMSCLLNQISKAKSYRHDDNKKSKSDSLYWCWHCWKCCRKFVISSNRRFSHVSVESKMSIFLNFDVDFATCSIFKIFDLTRFAFFSVCRSIRFCFSETFNFSCSCKNNFVDCIVANSLKEKIFVRAISKSCNEMNFDWSSNHLLTKSLRIVINWLNKFDSQYRCKHCWKCWRKCAI